MAGKQTARSLQIVFLAGAGKGLIQGFLSFYRAEAIEKLLDCVERRAMQFLRASQQPETRAKLLILVHPVSVPKPGKTSKNADIARPRFSGPEGNRPAQGY